LQAGSQIGRVQPEELADGDEVERRPIVIGREPFCSLPEETLIPTGRATLVDLPAVHCVLQHRPEQAVLRRELSVTAHQGGVLDREQEFVADRRIEPRSGGVHASVGEQEWCPRPSPQCPRARPTVVPIRRHNRLASCHSAGTAATRGGRSSTKIRRGLSRLSVHGPENLSGQMVEQLWDDGEFGLSAA
jgi:hypothetical protein